MKKSSGSVQSVVISCLLEGARDLLSVFAQNILFRQLYLVKLAVHYNAHTFYLAVNTNSSRQYSSSIDQLHAPFIKPPQADRAPLWSLIQTALVMHRSMRSGYKATRF